MISATSDNKLKFRNTGSILAFKLYGNNVQVSKLTLQGNDGERIAGKATVTMPVGGTPSVAMQSDATQSITLSCATPVTIGTSASNYTEFWIVVPPTDFTRGFTITVTSADGGTFEKATDKSVSLARNHIYRMAPIEVILEKTVKPDYVDLGLSVKWATFNVGATKPEEYGDYFAWGETKPKSIYYWTTYKWCNGSNNTLTKYNNDSQMGTVDHVTALGLEDDAAFANWGGEWRMPTKDEWTELFENCSGMWTSDYNGTGVAGIIVSGKMPGFTDNTIFLPAAGNMCDTDLLSNGDMCFYWSSSLNFEIPYFAYGVFFYQSYGDINYSDRAYGRTVRPVYGEFVPVTSISIDKPTLEMSIDETSQLTASVNPSNATAKDVHWISSDESIATVDETGLVMAKAAGSATIKAYGSSSVVAICTVMVKDSTPVLSVPEYVDLGLSVKWATFNVGATKPEEFGDHFAWGEIETSYEGSYSHSEDCVWKQGKESGYSFKSYRWCNGDRQSLTKYNCDPSFGAVDYRTLLDIEDDAAHAIWGDNWRIPTDAEWTELREKCNWTKTNINGIYGFLITSDINGNSIFLPFTDSWENLDHYTPTAEQGGFYWSSTLYTLRPIGALGVPLVSGKPSRAFTARCSGFSIRPVWSEYVEVQSVSLNRTSLDLFPEESGQLTATIRPSNATANGVLWVSSDKSIATVDQNGNFTGVSAGTASITVYASNGLSASCVVTVNETATIPNGYEYVDLGLPSRLKWATKNVGATKPEEYGEYFAWGETEPKTDYSWSTYKWCNGSYDTQTKYNTNASYGTVDSKKVLDPEDDAAHVNWGGSWRMPTMAEWKELSDNCTWTWTDNYNGTGVKGRIVTSNMPGYTDRSIFLPSAGSRCDTYFSAAGSYGYYLSSSLYAQYTYSNLFVFFSSDEVSMSNGSRDDGRTVRPVTY